MKNKIKIKIKIEEIKKNVTTYYVKSLTPVQAANSKTYQNSRYGRHERTNKVYRYLSNTFNVLPTFD